MRKILLTIAVLMIPMSLYAQEEITECLGCTIGVFEDQQVDSTRNYGFWNTDSMALKSIWVGIRYDPGVPSLSGLTGVELSVSGMPAGPFGDPAFAGVPDPAVVIGNTLSTPADSLGIGGVNMAWNTCLPNNRAIIRIDMLSLQPIANDIVLRVQEKFPRSINPYPLFTQCNGPAFTKTEVTGGCYVINPTVPVGEMVEDCLLVDFETAVKKTTWTEIKGLYRN